MAGPLFVLAVTLWWITTTVSALVVSAITAPATFVTPRQECTQP